MYSILYKNKNEYECIQTQIKTKERHILLFRRPLETNPQTGKAPPDWKPPSDVTDEERSLWDVQQRTGSTQNYNR